MTRTFTAVLPSLFMLGCSAQPDLPLASQHLRLYPAVAHVDIPLPVHRPTRRIIQILDWHFVSPEAFRADIPDADYEDHLTLVRTVQANQRRLLESLGVKAVYVESLTPENLEQFKRQLTVMQPPMETESGLGQFLQAEYELDLLRIGAVGQLAREGKLDVLPAEIRRPTTGPGRPTLPSGHFPTRSARMPSWRSCWPAQPAHPWPSSCWGWDTTCATTSSG